jgi:hypothetical protein
MVSIIAIGLRLWDAFDVYDFHHAGVLCLQKKLTSIDISIAWLRLIQYLHKYDGKIK